MDGKFNEVSEGAKAAEKQPVSHIDQMNAALEPQDKLAMRLERPPADLLETELARGAAFHGELEGVAQGIGPLLENATEPLAAAGPTGMGVKLVADAAGKGIEGLAAANRMSAEMYDMEDYCEAQMRVVDTWLEYVSAANANGVQEDGSVLIPEDTQMQQVMLAPVDFGGPFDLGKAAKDTVDTEASAPVTPEQRLSELFERVQVYEEQSGGVLAVGAPPDFSGMSVEDRLEVANGLLEQVKMHDPQRVEIKVDDAPPTSLSATQEQAEPTDPGYNPVRGAYLDQTKYPGEYILTDE